MHEPEPLDRTKQRIFVRVERGNHVIELGQQIEAWVTATQDVAGVAYEIAVNINEHIRKLEAK